MPQFAREFRLSLVIAAAFGAACSPAAMDEAPPAPGPDAVLTAYVDAGRVPGVVAVAATGERILHEAALGMRNVAAGEPMQLDTIFRIASMTKPITSVAVMQLVEQGKVNLDSSIAEYLPELAHPKVLEGWGEDGKPRLRDATGPPTIRELLSNTSGYAYPVWNADIDRYQREVKTPAGRDQFPVMPLASDPGTRWEYSPSTGILGVMVADLSGLTLEEYFRQHIFEPLGMHDTFFQIAADKWSRVTRQYQRTPGGEIEGPDQEAAATPPTVTYFAGDGGLSSTGPDYIRFVRAMLNGGELDGERILQAETVATMGQNQIGEFEAAGNMISVRPKSSNDVNLYPGTKDKFGLGFFLNAEPIPGGRARGTMMWAGIFNTYFWIDREQNAGGVLMTQLLPFGDPVVLEMLAEYEKAVYALPR